MLVEYTDLQGRSPFGAWFARLNAQAAARVATVLYRLAEGNLSNVKSVGKGVSEYKLNFGPGYRIYFGQHGDTLIILLAGGTKNRQSDDIRQAQMRWADYRRRQRQQRTHHGTDT
jgi:putative addiction module killer protein